MIRNTVSWILGGWFILSLLGQHPGGNHRNRILLYHLSSTIFMPNWSFFAPNPGVHDDHLFYRFVSKMNGSTSEWRELQVPEENKYVAMFYSRKSRELKGIIDIFSTLEYVEGNNKQQSKAVAPVTAAGRQAIANFILKRVESEHCPDATLEVLLVRSTGYEENTDPIYHYRFSFDTAR